MRDNKNKNVTEVNVNSSNNGGNKNGLLALWLTLIGILITLFIAWQQGVFDGSSNQQIHEMDRPGAVRK